MGNANQVKSVIEKKKISSYKQMISSSDKTLFVATSKGKLIEFSQPTIELFAASTRKEMSKTKFVHIVPKVQKIPEIQSKNKMKLIIENALKSEKGFTDDDFQWKDLRGKLFWTHIWITPLSLDGNFRIQCLIEKISKPLAMIEKEKEEEQARLSKEAKEEKQRLKKELESLKKSIKQLKFEKNKLTAQMDHRGSLEMRLQAMKERLENIQKESSSLIHEIDQANKSVKNHPINQEAKIQELRLLKKKLKFENQKLYSQQTTSDLLKNVRNVRDKIKLSEDETNNIQKEFIQKQEKLKDLQEALHTKAVEEKISLFQKKLLKKQTQIEKEKYEISNLTSFLRSQKIAAQQQLDSMKMQIKEKKNENKNLQKEVDALSKELTLAESDYELSQNISNNSDSIVQSDPISINELADKKLKRSNTVPAKFQNNTPTRDPFIKSNFNQTNIFEVLREPVGVMHFQDYLSHQFEVENLMICIAISEFKTITDEKMRRKKSEEIYKKFIKKDSIFEIFLENEERENLRQMILNGVASSDMFDEVQQIILKHLSDESLPNFMNTIYFQSFYRDMQTKTVVKMPHQALLVHQVNRSNSLNMSFNISQTIQYKYPFQVALELIKSLIDILASNFSIRTQQVDLNTLSQSIPFRRFANATSELQNIKLSDLEKNQIIPFFVNIYNLLYLHGAILNGVPLDKAMENKFFHETTYIIDHHVFSLNDILHGILRCNKPQPKSNEKVFSSHDKRLFIVPEQFDSRVHFALTDLDQESPPIRVFYPHNFSQFLEQHTKAYLTTYFRISNKTKRVLLPKMFGVFPSDFGENHSQIIQYISHFLDDKKLSLIDKSTIYTLKFSCSSKGVIIFDTDYNYDENI